MKSLMLQLATFGFALALGSALGCGSQGMGCGGGAQNPVNNGMMNQGSNMTCGPGTVLINGGNGPQCVAGSSH